MPPRAWKYWTSACFDHVNEKYNYQEQKIQKYCFCHLVELLNEGLVLDRVEVRGPLGQPAPTKIYTQNILVVYVKYDYSRVQFVASQIL